MRLDDLARIQSARLVRAWASGRARIWESDEELEESLEETHQSRRLERVAP